MTARAIEQIFPSVQGRPVRVFSGGSGSPLLLVHGGWGGAHFHWSSVCEQLARSHRVIAPDLPGLGATDQPALPSVRAYAEWLGDLLDVLGVARAWAVGNSFGASVAWSLAHRAPQRCAGLTLVNGFAMPKTPAPLRLAGRTRIAHALMERVLRRFIYTPAAVRRAFVDTSRVPPELYQIMETEWSVIVPRYVDILIAGDGSPKPNVTIHLLWGTADRLPGTTHAALKRLQRSLPDATLNAIATAGHFPQIEAPDAFVAAIDQIVARADRAAGARTRGDIVTAPTG
jgi:2-hydroxy-6-oxonona-2,4-dienedioate hydrolase